MVRATIATELWSLDDEEFKPNQRLYSLCAFIADQARFETHHLLSSRETQEKWYQFFPGEHYHLLSCLARQIKPVSIVEFGTGSGMGAISFREGYEGCEIVSFDTRDPCGELIQKEDNIRLIQGDMADEALFKKHNKLISKAEIIFVDGPKEDRKEYEFVKLLNSVSFTNNPFVIFDDMKLGYMLDLWRDIKRPKIDITSY